MKRKSLLNLFRICWIRSSWKLPVLVLICLFSSILELIGIGLVVPLINISFRKDSTSSEGIMRFFEDFFNYINLDISLNMILLIILTIFIFKNLFVFLGDIIRIWITTGIRKSIQNEIISLSLKV